jgi:toxin FitB
VIAFADRAIAIDVPIAETAGPPGFLEAAVLTVADSLIAGTAMAYDATLVTRNVKDFDNLSVALFNPFSSR